MVDREQIRRRMLDAVREGDPEFEHAGAIYAWEVLALLAELEQADRLLVRERLRMHHERHRAEAALAALAEWEQEA